MHPSILRNFRERRDSNGYGSVDTGTHVTVLPGPVQEEVLRFS